MDAVQSIIQASQSQSLAQAQTTIDAQSNDSAKTFEFQKFMQVQEMTRARQNALRKELTSILSEAMNVLKKTGDQIRQATGG